MDKSLEVLNECFWVILAKGLEPKREPAHMGRQPSHVGREPTQVGREHMQKEEAYSGFEHGQPGENRHS